MKLLERKRKKKEPLNLVEVLKEKAKDTPKDSYWAERQIELMDGPAKGKTVSKFDVCQDVLIMPVTLPHTHNNQASDREQLGPNGEWFAVYRRRRGSFYFDNYLTSDYIRRHKDLDKPAPIKEVLHED